VRTKSWKQRGTQAGAEPEERPQKPLDPEKAREKTMQRAIKLLAAKPRSIAEVRERLLEKQWTDEATVDAVIEKLREYGYLNDERFAFSFASYKVRQKPVGRGRLRRDLQLKKVDKEIADEALKLVFEETPEEQLIDRAIEKRARLRGRPQTRAEIKSLYDHLLRRGFSYELVSQKVRAASGASLDDEEDETV
jgi:SOS response regulatory protein OraA/RecX